MHVLIYFPKSSYHHTQKSESLFSSPLLTLSGKYSRLSCNGPIIVTVYILLLLLLIFFFFLLCFICLCSLTDVIKKKKKWKRKKGNELFGATKRVIAICQMKETIGIQTKQIK